jgi:outer membrane lipoprotein-sorting protein
MDEADTLEEVIRQGISRRMRMRKRMTARAAAVWCIVCAGIAAAAGQQVDNATILQKIDAAVKARVDGIEGYTVTEHYAVFRNNDELHPAAEMTVKTTYKRDTGKSYAILSQTGSSVMRSMVLNTILDNEKHVNEPGVREGAWITTANYAMQVKPGGIQKVDGRDCVALSLTPRRKEPFLLEGTLWVDANDGKIARIEGKATKSSSVFTGPTQMARQYANVDGFAQATHARAQSDSFLFGLTVVTIDYQDYRVQLRPRP